MSSSEPYGQAALMLCENLLHLLMEEGVITKTRALEAIEGVAELAREMAERDASRANHCAAVTLVEMIGESFAAKDEPGEIWPTDRPAGSPPHGTRPAQGRPAATSRTMESLSSQGYLRLPRRVAPRRDS
jgi:hypothetical protein